MPTKRILISLGVMALYIAGHYIPLPGVQPIHHDARLMFTYSIMALGVMPILTGFVLVELAALLVPGWRSLRMGDPHGRARLNRMAVYVSLVLSFSQAFVMILGLTAMGLIYPLEPLPRLGAVLTLMGAAAVQLALVQAVNRDGMGGGFSILILAALVLDASRALWRPLFMESSSKVPLGILAVLIVVGATLKLFRMWPRSDDERTQEPTGTSPATGGTSEYVEAMNSSRIIAVIGYWSVAHKVNLPAAIPPAVRLGILVAAALLFVWLFNPPAKMAEAWRRFFPNSRGGVLPLSIVLKECIAFIAVLSLVEFWTRRHLGFSGGEVMTVLLATAILCDLNREWRTREQEPDLVPVWDVHQTYVVPPLLLCLKNEGIRAFPQSLFFRSLLQFFGPYVPIRILVPAHQAEAAEAILRDRFSQAPAPVQVSNAS